MSSSCTWVIVADGARVRCFEERRRGAALMERIDFEMRPDSQDEVGYGDRPGRVHESRGATRHGVEDGRSAPDEREVRFLARASRRIAHAATEKLFDELVIFAPARALGEIRESLPERVRSMVTLDRPLDIVGETDEAVRARLDKLRHPGS